MSTYLLLFILAAVLLVLLLAWAVRPSTTKLRSPEEVLGALCRKRHYARLPQILQCLRPEDANFLYARGHDHLAARMRRERKRVAVAYLEYLEQEYRLLLEASRILARLAPQVSPMDELMRFRLNLRFAVFCRYLRWRLRLGLQPWDVFGVLSDMEGPVTLQLEAATSSIGERAAAASEFSLFLDERSGRSD